MYCKNCGYGGETKTACPRCGATGAYLIDIPATAQGPMYPILEGSIEEQRDQTVGMTNPNLHRRLQSDTGAYTYKFGIYGTDAIRYTEWSEHDEESETCEIP